MTLDEATKVAAVISKADGGSCENCAGDLAALMSKAFPDFRWWIGPMWEAEAVVDVEPTQDKPELSPDEERLRRVRYLEDQEER